MNSPEYVLSFPGNEEWVCLCGNTVNDDGFTPCESATDPTIRWEFVIVTGAGKDTAWDGRSFSCGRCNRVIDQTTYEPAPEPQWSPYFGAWLTHRVRVTHTPEGALTLDRAVR